MEGDAGASRLNPTGPREREEPAVDGSPETGDASVTEEHAAADAADAESDATTETVAESADGSDAADSTDDDAADSTDDDAADSPAKAPAEPTRLGRKWLIGIAAALILATVAVATGAYFASQAHTESADLARAETAAVAAAKDCVAATQAPDTASMAASQQKMVDCATGDYAVQAQLYSSVMVEAYQAADVKVKVTDMRAAVERHNDDGSLNVLVAFRMEVTNTTVANQETGMRLRVKMAPVEGQYRIAKLDQVAS